MSTWQGIDNPFRQPLFGGDDRESSDNDSSDNSESNSLAKTESESSHGNDEEDFDSYISEENNDEDEDDDDRDLDEMMIFDAFMEDELMGDDEDFEDDDDDDDDDSDDVEESRSKDGTGKKNIDNVNIFTNKIDSMVAQIDELCKDGKENEKEKIENERKKKTSKKENILIAAFINNNNRVEIEITKLDEISDDNKFLTFDYKNSVTNGKLLEFDEKSQNKIHRIAQFVKNKNEMLKHKKEEKERKEEEKKFKKLFHLPRYFIQTQQIESRFSGSTFVIVTYTRDERENEIFLSFSVVCLELFVRVYVCVL